MTKLSLTDLQRAVLQAAGRSANLVAWPLPRKLKLSPGSAAIVVRGLLKKGLITERPALSTDAVWREHDGRKWTLVVSKIGLAACGITADDKPARGGSRDTETIAASDRKMPRSGSKLALLIEMLSRTDGATVEQLAAATGWKQHTVRGVMSNLTRKLGLRITSDKLDGEARVYRSSAAT